MITTMISPPSVLVNIRYKTIYNKEEVNALIMELVEARDKAFPDEGADK